MFRSVSICAHVVATAEVNQCLQPFLNEVSRLCKPNLSAISIEGMPSGAGRKDGVQSINIHVRQWWKHGQCDLA